MTREWREQTGEPLSAVSGDDALAFATAFYSPDHPHCARPFEYQYTWGLPRKPSPDRGWAALCFRDQESCNGWMEWVSARGGHFVRREFTVRASLWSQPGLSREVIVLMALPQAPASAADDFSASRRGTE